MSQKITIENDRYGWITWNSRSHARINEDKNWSDMTARESWSKKWRMIEYQESALIKYQYQWDEREKVFTIPEVLPESLDFDIWYIYNFYYSTIIILLSERWTVISHDYGFLHKFVKGYSDHRLNSFINDVKHKNKIDESKFKMIIIILILIKNLTLSQFVSSLWYDII